MSELIQQNIETHEKQIEKRYKRRMDKKKKKMKVDGAQVKNLEKIISDKAKNHK